MVEKVQARLITEEQLMRLGSEARVEIINGELVEMSPVGILHHLIAGNVYEILSPFVKLHKLGLVFMDGLNYLLHKEGTGLKGSRVPDVSFVRSTDMPEDWDIERPFPGAPTLAVEVVSSDDSADDLLQRIQDYLSAGTRQVWVFYPRPKTLHVHQHDTDDIRQYRGDEVVDTGTLFPGLEVMTSAFFVVPEYFEK